MFLLFSWFLALTGIIVVSVSPPAVQACKHSERQVVVQRLCVLPLFRGDSIQFQEGGEKAFSTPSAPYDQRKASETSSCRVTFSQQVRAQPEHFCSLFQMAMCSFNVIDSQRSSKELWRRIERAVNCRPLCCKI